MTGKRLSEIRELLRAYRPSDDPSRQGELLTAAQDLFDLAGRGLRLQAKLRMLLAAWEGDVAGYELDLMSYRDDARLSYAVSKKVCAEMLRAALETAGDAPDA